MEQASTPTTTDYSLNVSNDSLTASLEEIILRVDKASQQCHNDPQQLLELLRTLEKLHQDIRMNLFEPSLPNSRNDLYDLLLNVEETGGWPYIERMKLQAFLQNLLSDVDEST
ncbi:MAG: hypothetical protein AB4062_11415 [Crocosphaera sp.]